MSSFDSVHPFRSLPRSADLGHLREEAKSLLKSHASGQPGAVKFVAFHRGKSAGTVKLADAQFVLARSYGFKSWARMKAFVAAQSRSPEQLGELLLQTLFTDNFTLLTELYARRESLPASDFFLAAALGNVAVVESMLGSDPTWASRLGGPLHTQAITYAAHARFWLIDDSYRIRQQQIVSLLLAHGADANSFVSNAARGEQGDGSLSALYGCCRQPGNPAIAKLLLGAGARVDDGESLYHASELHDASCLQLLFAAGVPDESRDYCIRRCLDSANAHAALAVYLRYGASPHHLDYALFRNQSMQIIRMLVEHGADLDKPTDDFWLLERIRELTPVQIAERAGATQATAYLLAQGAVDNRTPRDLLIGACARADEDATRSILRENPGVAQTLTVRDHGNIAALAREGRLTSVRLMLDASFDIDARADDLDATALHYAATNGDAAMAKLLLSRGARCDLKQKYGGTPLRTAIYCAANFPTEHGQYAAVVQLLIDAGEKVTDDRLEFALANDLDEIATVLKAHGASV